MCTGLMPNRQTGKSLALASWSAERISIYSGNLLVVGLSNAICERPIYSLRKARLKAMRTGRCEA